MIRVDRASVRPPRTLRSSRARTALKRLGAFFTLEPKERVQRAAPFETEVYRDSEVRDALGRLFHDKCAYCETPLREAEFTHVDHFRPKIRAVNLDGTLAPDGYWWLTYDWENLYLVCRNCNHLKGTRFPVEGTRAPRDTRGAALSAERPLLLDPCSDDPLAHLVFSNDGRVASSTDRGRTTCDILALNRDGLIEARARAFMEVTTGLAAAVATGQLDSGLVERLAGDALPYAAARRQFLAAWARENKVSLPGPSRSGAPAVPLPDISPEQRDQTAASFRVAERVQESYSIADDAGKAQYFARTRLIDRIEIENFRPIEHLSLRFPEFATDALQGSRTASAGQPDITTPWLMLLGENAAGKSSVLQAVALALIGEKWRNQFKFDASRFLRNGASDGYVRVTLTGIEQPIELRFTDRSEMFTSEPKEPKLLLLGYGSTRLLPQRDGKGPAASYDFARIDNLFDPFEPLNDAAGWMASLPPERFDAVARALRSILQLERDDRLICEHGMVYAEILGNRVTLGELSDGYQTLVALATDIMRVMLKRWDAIEIAEGIVLLDEIGSHLHPRWRMRMVEALRQTFPRIQFLVSTHDPLCLRGLATGEVVVIGRDASNRVYANTDLPPIGGLRVDQLLTSEYFGLNSTIDPKIEELFSEYYRLLALRSPKKPQIARRAELKGQLAQFRMLGGNQRERLMLEAIDQYLAEERASPSGNRIRLKAATRTRLAKIWASTRAGSRARRGGATP